MKKITTLLTAFILFLLANQLLAQTTTTLSIEGEVLRPLKFSLQDLFHFPAVEIKTKDRDNKEHSFKGVSLAAVLDSAGVTLGKQLRGENLSKYVLVKAADGYEVVFSLAEIDPEFASQTILLATSADGKPLPAGEGSFRLVVPQDKKHARWIREIVTVKILFSKD
jgi:DMSO/TMAO reductase YedYZ molybdopterin-dependent catalytic subunit